MRRMTKKSGRRSWCASVVARPTILPHRPSRTKEPGPIQPSGPSQKQQLPVLRLNQSPLGRLRVLSRPKLPITATANPAARHQQPRSRSSRRPRQVGKKLLSRMDARTKKKQKKCLLLQRKLFAVVGIPLLLTRKKENSRFSPAHLLPSDAVSLLPPPQGKARVRQRTSPPPESPHQSRPQEQKSSHPRQPERKMFRREKNQSTRKTPMLLMKTMTSEPILGLGLHGSLLNVVFLFLGKLAVGIGLDCKVLFFVLADGSRFTRTEFL